MLEYTWNMLEYVGICWNSSSTWIAQNRYFYNTWWWPRFQTKEDSWSRKWQVLNAAQARRDCNQSSIRAPILIIRHFGCWHKSVNHIICYTSRRICYFATWVPAPRNNHNTSTKSKILKKVLRRDFWPSKLTNVSHLFSEMYCGDACFFFVLRRCGRPCVGRLSPTFDNSYKTLHRVTWVAILYTGRGYTH